VAFRPEELGDWLSQASTGSIERGNSWKFKVSGYDVPRSNDRICVGHKRYDSLVLVHKGQTWFLGLCRELAHIMTVLPAAQLKGMNGVRSQVRL
jgi:hypothetical protein